MFKKILNIVISLCVITCINLPILTTLADTDTKAQGTKSESSSSSSESGQKPLRKERLPTLVKPQTLPGPVMRNEFQRTGRGTTEYLTTKLIPKLAIRITSYLGIGAIIGIMYGGILYIADLGKEENLDKAKNVIMYSIIALVIAIFAFAMVQVINLLPLNILS